jgi:hypothetical protein
VHFNTFGGVLSSGPPVGATIFAHDSPIIINSRKHAVDRIFVNLFTKDNYNANLLKYALRILLNFIFLYIAVVLRPLL